MIKYVLLSMLLLLLGCNLIEVNMVQKSVVDVGDGTADTYSGNDEKKQLDTFEAEMPLR